ncbi:hypothetical protein IWQ62_000845 [Dispira parvispora]|uniref:Uncharacterized protein n=1 Tax=Dispira parvispora TaxID=1520584 RepID=A0A9W8E5L6_9FUNG|nr:hypothetical protein IWQ62_000845 [Dispira parvispora]
MGSCCSCLDSSGAAEATARPDGSQSYSMAPLTKPSPVHLASGTAAKTTGGSYRLNSQEGQRPMAPGGKSRTPDRAAVLAAAERRAQEAQRRGAPSGSAPGALAKKLAQQQKMSAKELQEQELQAKRAAQDELSWRAD